MRKSDIKRKLSLENDVDKKCSDRLLVPSFILYYKFVAGKVNINLQIKVVTTHVMKIHGGVQVNFSTRWR